MTKWRIIYHNGVYKIQRSGLLWGWNHYATSYAPSLDRAKVLLKRCIEMENDPVVVHEEES